MGAVNALRDSFTLFQRDFGLALRRYARLPAAVRSTENDAAARAEQPNALLLHLPGVGWLVGIAACLVFALVALPVRENPWGAAVAAVACTFATVLLTRGLHERALVRAADALAPDASRAGTASGLGTLALVLVMAGKLVLLVALAAASEVALVATLFAAHVVSRFIPVAVAHGTAPAEVDRRALRIAALWSIVPLVLLVPAGGAALLLVPLLVAALAVYALLRSLRRRGTAFDDTVVGTVQQVSELAFYLGAVIAGG